MLGPLHCKILCLDPSARGVDAAASLVGKSLATLVSFLDCLVLPHPRPLVHGDPRKPVTTTWID